MGCDQRQQAEGLSAPLYPRGHTHMRYYKYVLAAGITLMSASAASGQAAASVCKDGTTSTAVGKGACSGHGGVDAKATEAAKKAAKPAKKVTKASDKAAAKET